MTLGDMILRAARLYGRQTAIVFEERRISFAAHAARACRLADALARLGVRRGDRVAILARNRPEYMEAFAAGELAGHVTVNLNFRLSEAELAAICADCAPTLLIHAEEYAATAVALAAANPTIRRVIGLGADYEALLAAASSEPPSEPARPGDTAYLIYTSGSTGKPKGVLLGHQAVIEACRQLGLETGVLPTDISLVVKPFFHIGGKIEQMAFNLLGGAIVLKPAFEAEDALATIERERVTVAGMAPIMIQRMLESPSLGRRDLSSLRTVHYASAPMPVPVLRRAIAAFGPIFLQVYGMTEAIVVSVLKPHQHRPDGDAADLRRLGSAGQPALGNEVMVARGDGSPCPPGEIGEILVRTPTVMQGYWGNQSATAAALAGGWYHTQDLGILDADGFLHVMDRLKDMIISGGENVYSWEVEEALRRHDEVAEVAVIGIPDEEWGEQVKACVVLRPGAAADAEALIAHCRRHIASYKKPRSIDFLDALPRLFNGKVDKKALRAPYWQGHERQVS